MVKAIRNWLSEKPWRIGIFCALLPIFWLWTNYPIFWGSHKSVGKVINTEIFRYEKLDNAGIQGIANVVCYQVRVNFSFNVNDVQHVGNQFFESCDLLGASQKMKELEGAVVTVVYDSNRYEQAFLVELISIVKLKLAAGLSIALFILSTWIAGLRTGIYKTNMLNIHLTKIRPRYLLVGFMVIIFYSCLVAVKI